MNIAPEVDKLMWSVAESGDARAIEDFVRRFPELKHELSKRAYLVGGLRDAKSLHLNIPPRPAFVPNAKGGGSVVPRGKSAIALSLVAGIAFAGVTYLKLQSTGAPVGQTPVVSGGAIRTCDTDARHSIPHRHSMTMVEPTVVQSPEPIEDIAHRPYPRTVPQKNAGAREKTDDVTLKQAPLQAAIHVVATHFGLSVETAPDLPNPSVDLEYHGQTGSQILQDMGKRYGFNVVEEGTNKYLLLP